MLKSITLQCYRDRLPGGLALHHDGFDPHQRRLTPPVVQQMALAQRHLDPGRLLHPHVQPSLMRCACNPIDTLRQRKAAAQRGPRFRAVQGDKAIAGPARLRLDAVFDRARELAIGNLRCVVGGQAPQTLAQQPVRRRGQQAKTISPMLNPA